MIGFYILLRIWRFLQQFNFAVLASAAKHTSENFIKQESQQSVSQTIEPQSLLGTSEPAGSSQLSQEDKIDRAKQLVEETKARKQAEEAEVSEKETWLSNITR